MQIYPAIDMKGGQCVRLKQGSFHDIKIYSDRPEEIALQWKHQGATFLHLVDLDGALAGHSVNKEIIHRIVRLVDLPIQIGGGIRNEESIEAMLALGVNRVIIGTKAVENPLFIRRIVERFGADKIVVGIDAKNGRVAIQGWEQVSGLSAYDLCMRMKVYGVEHVVYTDISKDGMLAGPNIAYTKKLSDDTGMDIIASGGISSIADLQALHDAGIQGAIIGKALYEKRLNLKEAVSRFE